MRQLSSGLVVAAPLRLEAALIRSAARGMRVHATGMGPAHAREAARELVRAPGDGLLVLGFCGGLDATSRPGEVVIAEEVVSAPGEEGNPARATCAGAAALTAAIAGRGMRVRTGTVMCVSKIAVGERRAELHAAGAIAVDMESVWLAAGAGDRPLGVVRVVLDSPSHELLRPGAVVSAVRASRALRRVAGAALHAWVPAG
jgi:4-hydroxy-3-methylbut-2-enyl diphosphate reductase